MKKLSSLNKHYNNCFYDMAKSFFERSGSLYNNYSVFYPSFGTPGETQHDFLFYGQSIKGWEPTLENFKSQPEGTFIKYCIEHSNDYDEERNHAPLDWVNVYWSKESYRETCKDGENTGFYPPSLYFTHRSYFWNVVYKLVNNYCNQEDNSWFWSRKIVWSNLYKIAPLVGQNPSNEECDWQWPHSLDLVKMEIEQIKPKYCVFLTNLSWMHGFDDLMQSPIIKPTNDNLIEYLGSYNETKIIVTKRPFYGNSSILVDLLYDLIKIVEKNP